MTQWGRASETPSKPEIRLRNDTDLVGSVLELPEMGAQRAALLRK